MNMSDELLVAAAEHERTFRSVLGDAIFSRRPFGYPAVDQHVRVSVSGSAMAGQMADDDDVV